MRSRNFVIVGIITLALTPAAFADGVAQAVDSLESQISTLQTENTALKAVITSLVSTVDDLVEQQRCHQNATQRVDWSGCTFTWLDLWNEPSTDFVEDNLFAANLSHATFRNSNFIYVIGISANLEGTTFEDVNLAYGDWTNADIVTAEEALAYGRTETIFIRTTCPDETYIDDSRISGETCEGHLSY